MALPSPSEVLGKKKSGLPSPDEVLGNQGKKGLPTPDEVLGTHHTVDFSRSDRMMSTVDSSNIRNEMQLQTNADRADRMMSAADSSNLRASIQSPAVSNKAPVGPHKADYASEPPIIRDIHRGLQWLGNVTKPAADFALENYTPGAGVSVVMGAEQSAANLIGKLAPGLGKKLGGKIVRTIATQSTLGAPLGVGNELARNPAATNKELLTAGAYGAGGGAAIGTAGQLAKAGVEKGVRSVGNALRGAQGAQMGAVDSAIRADLPTIKRTVGAQAKQAVKEATPAPEGSLLERFRSIRDGGGPVEQAAARTGPVRLADLTNDVPVAASVESPTATVGPSSRGQMANHANQLNNGNFSPELKQGIAAADHSYDVAHNVDSLATANENVKNLSKAEADFHANESGGADHIATGYRLMQELDALGEHQRELNVSKKMEIDLLKSGQTSQAASILSRLSPEGQLLNLTRVATRNGKEVTVADKVKFQELAVKVQENSGAGIQENHINTILNRLEKGDNVTPEDLKSLGNFLDRAKKVIKPKDAPVIDELPREFNDVKKRDKIISFLDNAEQAALARIQARKTRLNALPIDEWMDHAIVVSSQIAKGTIKAATHVEDLVRLFGDEIRPYASQVFQQAQGMIKGVTRTAATGNYEKASEALSRMSGHTGAQKAIVEETAAHVKKLIADAKAGTLDAADIQKLRDYSDEVATMLENDTKPRRIPTQEEKFLQSVKSLAKKIAQVESENIPANQANREVSGLLRQITKLADEGSPALKKEPIDNNALSNIAHDVMEKTRPNPKPTTLQEKIVEKYIKENPSVTEKDITTLRELAKNVTRLAGDQRLDADMAMQKILNSYEKSNLWDKTQAIRYIDMLFNSSTQAINAISGPIMASTGAIADLSGTMVDIAMNKVLKTPRSTTLYGTNPLKFMARWFKGAKVGGKAGALGVNPAGIAGANDIRGLTYKSLYNPLGLAERGLGAVAKGADYATYSAVYQSELRKIAYLDAKNAGIKGRQNIKQHVEAFLNDPSEKAMLEADRIGKNTTFQRSDTLGGKAANFLHSAPGPIKPLAGTIFPFVRTPINIASTAVTLTPGGIIKGLYQLTSKSDASQREALRTLSMGLTGTGMSAIGYYLSQLGVITGANDSGDKNVDAIREQTGGGKYRFNTSALSRYLTAMVSGKGSVAAENAAKYQKGDKQFDYNKLQPLAFPLAIGAGLQDNKSRGVAGALAGAGTDAYGSLYGMSTLKGVQDVFQPSYGGTMGEKALGAPTRIVESFLKSFSPSALGQEARRQDPIQRKTSFNNGIKSDVGDYFKSRTPGLSQSLSPNKTTLGQNKLNAPGIKGQYLNPYKSDIAPYNEAAVVISRLIDSTGDQSLAPSAPSKKVTGKDRNGVSTTIAIPQKRYEQLQEEVGNEVANRILAIPQNLDDAHQADKVRKIYEDVNTKYRNIVKRELGIRVG